MRRCLVAEIEDGLLLPVLEKEGNRGASGRRPGDVTIPLIELSTL